jgi:N-acetylmuramoyl-L-alanine amidase
MKRLGYLLPILLAVQLSAFAQRTDLSGLKFCIDPGHGGHNSNDRQITLSELGTYFWESESNFRKALLLKSMLEAKGAWVILTRTSNDTTGYPNPDDSDEPSLSARSQLANDNNVDWFHSIHSNAYNGATNYTLVLLKEDIPSRQAAFPEALTMSNIISPMIRQFLRTTGAYVYLDYTFYGGPSGGYNLGVLKNLLMPGELSEGSFHDVPAEVRRLMNSSYRKMEAYALRNSFLQYYGVPAEQLSIVAGIQRDTSNQTPINSSNVVLLPDNRVSVGDIYNNGFYMVDSVAAGNYTLRFATSGYYKDSVAISLQPASVLFVDRSLLVSAYPGVAATTPLNNDTAFAANASIIISFTKPMDTASVRSAFSISPPAEGSFLWSANLVTLTYDPAAPLPFYTTYTLKIDTSARSQDGLALDANRDGIPGDPLILSFRTRWTDIVAPTIVSKAPLAGDTVHTPNYVLNFTFDEPLNPASVTLNNFAVTRDKRFLISRTVEYQETGGKSGVTVYPQSLLAVGALYGVNVSGVSDKDANVITPTVYDFRVSSDIYTLQTVDSLNLSLSRWLQPAQSPETVGIDSASFTSSSVRKIPTIAGNPASALLRYDWNGASPDHFIRVYLDTGAAKSVRWRKSGTVLQIFLNGDGSGTQFRFAVDDSVDAFPDGTPTNHEVSPWTTIDWVGWRLVEWDMDTDSVGGWVGNGLLEGEMRFDSFQYRMNPGGSNDAGSIYLDQLQLAKKNVTGVGERSATTPLAFALHQNYPNPFNPTTEIGWEMGASGWVRLAVYDLLGREVAVLANGRMEAGHHRVTFDGKGLASGVYLYRLSAGGNTFVRKMLLTR